MRLDLGQYKETIEAAFLQLQEDKITERIWDHDYTVWSDSPEEITNRLDWLRITDEMKENIGRIKELKQKVEENGYTHVLLLGMGGSSLAPEVFSETFHDAKDRLWLEILDTTDPRTVRAYDETLDLSKTLFIVSTKSGGTAETLSAFKYFYNKILEMTGNSEETGKHFVAITDPGSKLEALATEHQFLDTFLNNPNIGGRYSVLSYFGLVPAALAGTDVDLLLDRASQMAEDCKKPKNDALYIGTVMGVLANKGIDKNTFLLSPSIHHFGDWAEQLIAESTGKNNKGILPVVGEALAEPDVYGKDRLFIYIQLQNESLNDTLIKQIKDAGHPLITIELTDRYDIGGQFLLWEMATAVAGHVMGIQPFDQPNVESAKKLARAQIASYQETGKLETITSAINADGIEVFGATSAETPADALLELLEKAVEGSYISIHAYVNPNEETTDLLQKMQKQLRDKTKLATTIGYGPRFLHSTGQLHKGDSGKGLFIQITDEISSDLDIPDEAGNPESTMSFGTLKEAQTRGDRQALIDAKRNVLRFHMQNLKQGLSYLIEHV